MRHFHSYGPVDPRFHYCVPRTELTQRCADQLLGDPGEGGHYFTIWAPRQSGKTWLMRQVIEEIRARHGDRFIVGTVSMQDIEVEENDPPSAFFKQVPQLLWDWFRLTVPAPADWSDWGRLFKRGTSPFERPLILLVDEFDRLPPQFIDKLVAQFRGLYLNRETTLLHGLALIGVRAVLGAESSRGPPFNVQRSLHVPNLTPDEVTDMFRQYQDESGQSVDPQVVSSVCEVTRGQPGLVGWFGELLAEKYNPGPPAPITMRTWDRVFAAACQIEPNNTILNLLKKALRYRSDVVQLFSRSDVPFAFGQPWCNYLYMNGVLDFVETTGSEGKSVYLCRFSCPFVQLRLYTDLSAEMDLDRRVPVVDPRDDLTDVFARLDLAALLGRYRDYLRRLKLKGINPWEGQPRRADMHLTEAVGHFHLYWWLVEATRRHFVITPEFPTGNGKVDLHIGNRERAGVIEVKSFTQRSDLPLQKEQAARYARSRNLPAATLAVFVPTDDEDLLQELSRQEVLEGVQVTTVAIGAV